MRYDFVGRHRDRWPVRLMCRVPARLPRGLLRLAGKAGRAPRTERREALVVAIKAIHGEVKARATAARGSHAELVARGEPCCVNTVARLMRQNGIAAKTKRKFPVHDRLESRPSGVAENVVNRDFKPTTANRTWTADITYIATGEGWLYLAVVEDLYSNQIIGWSKGSRIDSR